MKRMLARVFCAVSVALLVGGNGCSCQGGTAAADLNLSYLPTTIDFGTVPIQTSKPITVTLSHVGSSGTIQISDVHVDSSSPDFTVEGPDLLSLTPGQETTVTVIYSPLSSSDASGYLVIKHNVPPAAETRIPISANGQLADLIANPNPVDFEAVLAGDSKTLDVQVKNIGTDSVTVKQVYLKTDGSPDFSLQALVLPEGQALPVDLAPGDDLGLVLQYRPEGGNDDSSYLVIEGETRGSLQDWNFEVLGSELGPVLVAAPGIIDYQWVPLNETRQQGLMISNTGNADLDIGSLYVVPGSDANIVITDAPTGSVKIGAGSDKTYLVTWTAREAKPGNTDPIGSIGILSNDPKSPTLIPVFGRVDAPFLSVVPDFVDFGYCPQNQATPRTLTIRNDGHGPLTITSLAFTDLSTTQYGTEFAFVIDPKYATGPAGEWVVEGNQSIPVTLTFTNKGPATGNATGKVVITSNSPGNGTVTVGMTASRSGSPVCKIALVPTSQNFGTVAEGFHKELSINLMNTGSGFCSFRGARIEDCIGFAGMGVTCVAPGSQTTSSTFQFMPPMPPMIMNGIAPGAAVPLRIRFTPKNVASAFGQLTEFNALLSVKIYDAANKLDIALPAPGGGLGGTYSPNLKGTGGIAKVSVLPDKVDFGKVTIGCWSRPQKICIYNTGSVALNVTDITLTGCTPEFKKKNVPALPKAVSPAVPFCFEVAYAPQDEGPDECTMQVSSDDTTVTALSVALIGEGTYDTHQTDTFKQVSGQDVDVLFVIDDSGSMCDKQQRLTDNFASFIGLSTIWNNNFHIGVMSLNVVIDAVAGKLNRGNKNVTPRYVVPGTQAATQLKNLVNMGCDGGSDEQEAALQAGQAALSAPLTTDTGVSCTGDDACKNDKNLCSDPKTCPYYCIEGTCGGWNKGFMRQDAQLEIIILSDEEDQSSSTPAFYIDFFKNIKGYYNVNMMHVNTIVGIDDGSGQGICTASDGTVAQASPRYLEVAGQTGGKQGTICDPTFATVMNEIGAQAFGLKVQFYLSRLADPATVTVKVRGTACATGWTYDAVSNSVLFDETNACMPQPGDEIVIDYETLCLNG
jgi:hypothetical protein